MNQSENKSSQQGGDAPVRFAVPEALLQQLSALRAQRHSQQGWRQGAPLTRSGLVYATVTTMSLASIVACQIGADFACRSDHQANWRLGFTSNRMLLIGIVVEVALLLLLIYAPLLQTVFGLALLGIEHWLLLAAFGPLLLVCEEGRKAVWRRFSRT